MADILPFQKPAAGARNKGKTLCRRGFHKWKAEPGTPFDVKTGRLVTRFRCARCGATRVESR